MPPPNLAWRYLLTYCLWMANVKVLPIVMSVFLLAPSEPLLAQPAISRIAPQAVAPGKTTRIQIVGQNLKSPLRFGSTAPVSAAVVSVDPTQATIDITVPTELGNGPFGAWIATTDGPSEPFPILIDPLPSISDNETNHALSQSQQITLPCAVDGTADASLNDFYRLALEAGTTLNFDIAAERIGSSMDATLRIYDATGKILYRADDNEAGPDCWGQWTAPAAGEYFVEVSDSRYAGGGRYRLRLTHSPVGGVPYPLAISNQSTPEFFFLLPDGTRFAARPAEPLPSPIQPSNAQQPVDRIRVSPAGREAEGGWWGEILHRDIPLHCEQLDAPKLPSADAASEPLGVPFGWSGRLAQPGERDTILVSGTQGQSVRISVRTRSLGSPTVLRMQMTNPAGQVIAESPVSDADEWGLDVTFAEMGVYKMTCSDLLQRGGPHHVYWIEVVPKPSFAIAIKPDPNLKESRPLEPERGALFVDLQIQRLGFNGPIQLDLVSPPLGIHLWNPIIPNQATEHRLYLTTDTGWDPQAMHLLRWIAKSTEGTQFAIPVSNLAARRTKAPHQPFPSAWMGSQFFVSGIPSTQPLFQVESQAPIPLAKLPIEQSVAVKLQRPVPDFKGPLVPLATQAPAGWTAQTIFENDTLKVVLQPAAGTGTNPPPSPSADPVTIMAYAQHLTGRLEHFSVPLTWYDPLQVEVGIPPSVLPGNVVPVRVTLKREGNSPQPVTVQIADLPSGLRSEGPVIIAADQSSATIPLHIPAEFSGTAEIGMRVVASSQLGGKEFQVSSATVPLRLEPWPVRVEAFPASITLHRNRDRAHALLTAWDAKEMPSDWTQRAKWTSSNPAVFQWQGGEIIPVGNGQAELIAELGPHRKTISVIVQNQETPARVEFENEVLVALSKQGCNSGACHGSPSGKGSFRLSLRAFDRELDGLTLVREEAGRRINPIEPERSLLLLKPLMKVPHGGGVQIHTHDPAFALLRDWIQQGAPLDPADQARCVRLEVYPHGQRIVSRSAGQQSLIVIAHFADGNSRDVTSLTSFESSNTSVATVNIHGHVQPLARGETVIMARFLEHIESVPFLFVEEDASFVWQDRPTHNFLDTLVDAKLRQMQIQPSPLCSDEVFLRRVYLDVIGILPSVEESVAFLSDPSPDKRQRLIDTLLQRPEHAKYWALKWGDLLRLTSKSVGNDGVYKYHRWVEDAIRDNLPYDVFVKQLIASSGSTFTNPPANFYRTAADANDCVETISQVFLGARLQCAKCHNHPFERWTQDNYYGLAAFFQRVQRKKTERPGEFFVWSQSSGEVVQPRTGRTMKPWAPGAGEIELDPAADRREAFVAWLSDSKNPFLARVEANRIWSHLFARGIVDPIDDFRDSNPPTNRPLLDALTESFVASGFDRRQLIRTILQSRTYQASYETHPSNEKDTLYFSHQQPRLLKAESLLDAINQMLQTDQNFGSLPPGTKATQVPAPDLAKVDFLKVFGQPERSTVCACERSEDSNLGMAIELFNGSSIHEKLRAPNNRFRKAMAAGKPLEEILRELYLAGLCRQPTPEEIQDTLRHCQSRPDPVSGLEDICWVLINTDEFLFQH
jgi:hypothetical protein